MLLIDATALLTLEAARVVLLISTTKSSLPLVTTLVLGLVIGYSSSLIDLIIALAIIVGLGPSSYYLRYLSLALSGYYYYLEISRL